MRSIVSLLLVTFIPAVTLGKQTGSRPYVRSYLDGAFYIKAVPNAKTVVFEVQDGTDKMVDAYPWFSEDAAAVELAWSPVVGKVAVARLVVMPSTSTPERLAAQTLSSVVFYLGGHEVKTYTLSDLARLLGTKLPPLRSLVSVLEVRQVPSTNDYLFVLHLPGLKELTFDIVTAAIRP
jgi:hypothetical protein